MLFERIITDFKLRYSLKAQKVDRNSFQNFWETQNVFWQILKNIKQSLNLR